MSPDFIVLNQFIDINMGILFSQNAPIQIWIPSQQMHDLVSIAILGLSLDVVQFLSVERQEFPDCVSTVAELMTFSPFFIHENRDDVLKLSVVESHAKWIMNKTSGTFSCCAGFQFMVSSISLFYDSFQIFHGQFHFVQKKVVGQGIIQNLKASHLFSPDLEKDVPSHCTRVPQS